MTKAAELAVAQPSIDLSNYCLWEERDRGVRIYLNRSLVSRLHMEVRQGSDGSASMFTEVGGILLGRRGSDGTGAATFVDDFVPVGCDYERGPFYCLSKADTANFESILETCQSKSEPASSVIGYYRSHNRDDLYLTSDDLKLIHKYFSEADKVFLLIKTLPSKACTAGFFFWEDGYIQTEFTYLEIPFSPAAAADFGAADFGQVRTQLESAKAPANPPNTAPEFPATEWPRFRRFDYKVWLAAGAALALAMVVILVGLNYRSAKASQIPGILPASNLGLHVQRNAGSLALTWNQDSPDVIKANNAILEIRDGNNQTTLRLDQAELRSGSVPYVPSSEDVQFDFQMYRNGRISSVDSLHLLMTSPPVAAPAPSIGNAAAPASQDISRGNTVIRQPIAAAKVEPLPPARQAQEDRQLPANRFVPPNNFLKSSASLSNAATAREEEAGLDSPPSLEIEIKPQTMLVSSTIQPVAPPPNEAPKPKLEQKMPEIVPPAPTPAKITPTATFVGPKLIRQVSPRIRPDLRSIMTGDFQIDVEVSIDAQGKVSNARVTSPTGIGAALVTKEVLEAARLCVFQPARKNNTNVQSSMVLSFHFKQPN